MNNLPLLFLFITSVIFNITLAIYCWRHRPAPGSLAFNFRRMLEATPDAMLIVDQTGRIVLLNVQCEKMFGYSQAELRGKPVEILISEHLRELHKSHRADYYRNPQARPMGATSKWNLIALRKGGDNFPVEISLSPFESEIGSLTMAAVRDITERRQMEHALREAESKYRMLVEHMPAVMYMDEPDEVGTSAYVSPQVEALLGYPLAEWEKDQYFWSKCLHPHDYERAMAVTHNTLSQGYATGEYRMIASDGREIWVRDHSILLRDADGQPKFLQGFVEDVTERRKAEDLLRQQKDYLAALHQISLDLLNRRNVDNLLDAILSNATRLLKAPYSDLDIVEGDEMVTRACTANQGFAQGARTRRGESGFASWQAYDTLQPVVINDYSNWAERNPFFDSIALHATIVVPLIIDDRCLGVFSLSRTEMGNPFTADEVQLTSLFAQQAAMALANAQLHAHTQHEIEERKRTEEMLRSQNDYLAALHEVTLGLINRLDPDSVLEAELDHLTTLMKTHHAVIELVDPLANILIQKISVGNFVPQNGFHTARGVGLTGRVWDTGKSLIIPNYPTWEGKLPEFNWVKSVAGIPLKVGEQVIGVISVAFDEPGRGFKPEEVDLLQRFANLAAMALDNARLVAAAVRQSQELRLLHEVRSAIVRELDLSQIVKRTVEAIAETFGYTLVSVYLRKQDTLILQHQVGYDRVIQEIPITQGISGRVVRTGKPVLLDDVRSDPSFLGAIEGIVSEVIVPITDEGRVVGILNIESRYGVKLTEADLRLMLAISDQMSVAMSRASLYSNLTRNNERLSMLHQITLDLLKERNMEDLLQAIVDQVSKLLTTDMGYLSLLEGDLLVDRAFSPRNTPYPKLSGKREEDKSPVWRVLDTRQPFITDDYSSLPNLGPQTVALNIKAGMLLPLLTTETCKGVLGAGRLHPDIPFNEEDIQLGDLFARVAGLTIDNAQLHETLRQESIRDPLTGLFNRRFMEETLSKELSRADRNTQPLAVVMLDLDHFKRINDTFGHDGGDKALRRLSLLLKTRIRGSDIICRYGGEEFTLILPDASLTGAVQRMEQLRTDIKQLAIAHQGKSMDQFTGSFGIAVFPEHGTTSEALLSAADAALYRAKQSGRDRVMTA